MDPIGLLGPLLSLWYRITRRPRLTARFDWIQDPEGRRALRFSLSNLGSRGVVIHEIRFGTTNTPADRGWLKKSIDSKMPQNLEPDSSSPTFMIVPQDSPLEPGEEPRPSDFDYYLGRGEITQMRVEYGKSKTKSFPVPLPP